MHPLHDFKYCPHCGAAGFAEYDAYSKRCVRCGFTFYPNAAAATVAVIINSREELLCIVRDREPAKGTLDLPGGFVDPGESITDGLFREVREEVGAEVEHAEFLFSIPNVYPFSGHEVHTTDAFFRCTLVSDGAAGFPGTRLRAGDDAAALCWIPLAGLRPEAFGLMSVRKGVERLVSGFSAGSSAR